MVGAPAVLPLDELDGEDEGDGEIDLGETVVDEAVGVVAQLPKLVNHELVRSTGHRRPRVWDPFLVGDSATLGAPGLRRLAQTRSVMPTARANARVTPLS